MRRIILFAVINSICVSANNINHENSVPRCSTKDANECVKNYLQEAIKFSSQGSEKFSIPSLDPYFVQKLQMQPSKNVGGVLIEMRNATSHGFSNSEVKKVEADPKNGNFEIHYDVPVSTLLSNYYLSGKVFNIPINGKGRSNVTLVDVYTIVNVRGNVSENKENQKYLDVKSVEMHLKPKLMRVKFEQLFKDNKNLGDVINNMMNDNWQDIFSRLQPRLEEEMSKHLYKLVKRYFEMVPYNDMFPDL